MVVAVVTREAVVAAVSLVDEEEDNQVVTCFAWDALSSPQDAICKQFC